MDREYVLGLFTLVGVVGGSILTFFGGIIQARRAGLAGVSVAHIGAQSHLVDSLIERLNTAEQREGEWRERWEQMHEALHQARVKYDPIVRDHARQGEELADLRQRVDECERWRDEHDRHKRRRRT